MGIFGNAGVRMQKEKTPLLIPRFCIGGGFDIPCAEWQYGKEGEFILSGGFASWIAIGGLPNSYKTALSTSWSSVAMTRYGVTSTAKEEMVSGGLNFYCTEGTAGWGRLQKSFDQQHFKNYDEFKENGDIVLMHSTNLDGSDYWDLFKEYNKEAKKLPKSKRFETPFHDHDEGNIWRQPMTIWILDSISNLKTKKTLELEEKNSIDDSANNTLSLRSNLFKTKIAQDAPRYTYDGGSVLITTMHVGKDSAKYMDPHAPGDQQYRFMQNGLKFKDVPEKVAFLSSIGWIIEKTGVCVQGSGSSKSIKYPKNGQNAAGTSLEDLQKIHLMTIRNKHGQTAYRVTTIFSQSDGWLPHLGRHDWLGENKFGYREEGVRNDRYYHLAPDTKVTRLGVREQLPADRKLRRAIDFTADILQYRQLFFTNWYYQYSDITLEMLYSGIKELGYDWNVLLNTRSYWKFNHYNIATFNTAEELDAIEDENRLPYLDTRDLLRMFRGEFVPAWYPKELRAKLKPELLK